MNKGMNNSRDKQPPKLGRVNDLTQRLYAKKSKIKPYQRAGLHQTAEGAEARASWDTDTATSKIDLVEKPKRRSAEMTVFTKLLIVSVLFFIGSAVAAYMIFTYGQNEVTFDAVEVSVLGPNTIKAGEELEFDVRVTNNNPVEVVLSDVIVQYPGGTITATPEAAPMSRDSKPIEQIIPGFSESIKFKSILFGAEGETRDIRIRYQYRVPASNQIFFKEREYSLNIESAPVVLEVSHPRSYENGDTVTLEVDVISNASKRVQNLLLTVDYPFGFEYASSSIPFFGDQGTFVVGVISPGERKTYSISGVLTGQPEESRTFRYALGVQQSEQRDQMGSVYTRTESSVSIEREPVTLAISIDGNTDSLQVINAGTKYRAIVNYENNQDDTLIDAAIEVLFRDDTYQESKTTANNGFYDSNTNIFRWTRNDYTPLAQIDASDRGSVQLDFTTTEALDLAGKVVDPQLRLTANLEGSNFTDERDDRLVGTEVTKRLKIRTELGMQNTALHSIGPFDNNGPLIPIVGEATQYTIYWKLFNTTSDADNVTVRAQLPPYITWLDQRSPENASITYNERTRQITWNAGELAAGVGYGIEGQEVSFQIEFTPSLTQVGQFPTLIPQATVTGYDTFTETEISVTADKATTRLEADPEVRGEFDMRVRAAE